MTATASRPTAARAALLGACGRPRSSMAALGGEAARETAACATLPALAWFWAAPFTAQRPKTLLSTSKA